MDRKNVQEIQSLCLELYKKFKKEIDDIDTVHISDFPAIVIR